MQGSTSTNTKHYFFGGQRIAQKVGSDAFTYLHTDHLGSVVETTGVVERLALLLRRIRLRGTGNATPLAQRQARGRLDS